MLLNALVPGGRLASFSDSLEVFRVGPTSTIDPAESA
jgi:hypothetical protein